MSTTAKTETDLIGSAGGLRSELGGRAERPAGGAPIELPPELREQLSDEVIDQLLAGARTEEEIVGPGGVLAQLTKRLVERALQAELTDHLGYEPHQEPPGGVGNTRNGATAKTWRPSTARSRSAPRATATRPSSRRSSGRGSGASRASTTRSSSFTRAAS